MRPFLRQELDAASARARLEDSLEARERTFLHLLRSTVFDHPTSPYWTLLRWARISLDDVAEALRAQGLEATLELLLDAGVFVTLEEFKGLEPLVRPGLELPVRAEDFDNPMRQYTAALTGGSGGRARHVRIGLGLLDHESAYHSLFYAACANGPAGAWLPAPPGAVGIKNALIRARMRAPIERWFSQSPPSHAPLRYRALAKSARVAARMTGSRIPPPDFTPAGDADRVARWMAECRAAGSPATLLTTPSAAVRVCKEAGRRDLDVSGSFFVIVGEPYTSAKAAVIADAGCSAASHYAMVEAGMIGLACRAPAEPDDVHLVSDKIATIQRDRLTGPNAEAVPALFHTTLLPISPKVMLNVESGDYGVLEERECGCGVLPPAFRRHLHTIRSYEKLTSEGMHFTSEDLLDLLERFLPGRFGGHPTDYQFVEREDLGLPKVTLVVSPAVGPLDPAEIVRAILRFLRRRGVGQELMAEVWANGDTLQVVRAEPRVTAAGKIQALERVLE
jgi:hypothetical protein